MRLLAYFCRLKVVPNKILYKTKTDERMEILPGKVLYPMLLHKTNIGDVELF